MAATPSRWCSVATAADEAASAALDHSPLASLVVGLHAQVPFGDEVHRAEHGHQHSADDQQHAHDLPAQIPVLLVVPSHHARRAGAQPTALAWRCPLPEVAGELEEHVVPHLRVFLLHVCLHERLLLLGRQRLLEQTFPRAVDFSRRHRGRRAFPDLLHHRAAGPLACPPPSIRARARRLPPSAHHLRHPPARPPPRLRHR
mmetsp:Transcript_22480/g.55901  ORF Transcript_22480/g.55901 Transcript_22480/m.55901 type:complete len:201 (-) Transcript_22480:7-609(-)